jgi:hypothetical protein
VYFLLILLITKEKVESLIRAITSLDVIWQILNLDLLLHFLAYQNQVALLAAYEEDICGSHFKMPY